MKKGPGYKVETAQGSGRTYHSDDFINGKQPVYLDNGDKMLIKPENLKVIGFID